MSKRKRSVSPETANPKSKIRNQQSIKPGRVRGSKNILRDEHTVVVSRCKRCDSTRRHRYSRGRTIVRDVRGATEPYTGKPCTHMVIRPTRCLDCNQARNDVHYLYEPESTAEEVAGIVDSEE